MTMTKEMKQEDFEYFTEWLYENAPLTKEELDAELKTNWEELGAEMLDKLWSVFGEYKSMLKKDGDKFNVKVNLLVRFMFAYLGEK